MAGRDDPGRRLRLPYGRAPAPRRYEGLEAPRVEPPPPVEPPPVAEDPGPPPAPVDEPAVTVPAGSDDGQLGGALERLEAALADGFRGLEEWSSLLEEQVAGHGASVVKLGETVNVALAGLEERVALLDDRVPGETSAVDEVVGAVERLRNGVATGFDEAEERARLLGEQVAGEAAAAIGPMIEASAERLQLIVSSRLGQLAQQISSGEAERDARFEKLEARLEAGQAGSADAAGNLAGQVLDRVEELVTARLAEAQAVTMEAIGALASKSLLEELIDGVVVTGEVVEAELVALKRLVVEQRRDPSDSPPA